jgi:hypothetical protein
MKFVTINQATLGIFDYIEAWYNPQRIHSKLGYLSPNEFEKNSITLSCNVVSKINKNVKIGAKSAQL